MNRRARIVICGLAAVYLLIVLRAFHIQVLGVRGIRERGERQYNVSVPLVAKRGAILDRTGNELAVSLSTKSIFIQPAKLSSPGAAADLLAPRIGRPVAELRKQLASERHFLWIRRQMPSAEADDAVHAVRAALGRGKGRDGEDAIGTVEEPKRFYPNRELAASILGFTNVDSVGIEGLELSLDKYLRGERGYLVCERDARGRVIAQSGASAAAAANGHSVVLTIDRNVQHVAQAELAAAVQKYDARGGIAVVMLPKTGEILAMATVPTYNPNAVADAKVEDRKNRAITDSFEPGSTFKIFTLASALEMGAVDVSDRIFCENGAYRYAGRVIHDTHRYGWLTVPEVIKFSSNIGATKISDKMEGGRFFDMVRAFGFGTRTGIELAGEIGGLVPSRDGFTKIRRATVSFGQGIAVTPLQLCGAMAAVINGGKVMRPYVVREIRAPGGNVVYRGEPRELRRVVSPKTSSRVREILGKVVQEDGTGTQARIKGFIVGGKTGTAQKVEVGTGRYSPTKRIASFIGFLPLQDPELLILVVIDEPKGQVYGGVVAAPAFNQIAVKTAYYLGIPPTETVAGGAVAQGDDAKPATVRVERAAARGPEGPLVMPDLRGLSMGRVVDVMGRYSVKLSLEGTGVARRQSPAPGAVLHPGAECTVAFSGAPEAR